MKRSEMVSIIALNIAKQAMTKGPGGLDISWISASNILKSLEMQGMKPPFNEESWYLDGDNADEHNVRYYTWEPEDE
jgi:hypothetical protein